MAKLGWIKATPRYPAKDQREKLATWGATKIYEHGKDTDDVMAFVKSIRPRDAVGVFGIHRFAPNMKQLTAVMAAIAKRGATVQDLELDLLLPPEALRGTAAYANAKRVYDGESRGTPAEYAERGAKGGRKAAKTLRVPLGSAHRQVWFAARTNLEAAQKISDMLKREVSVQTLRRKFGVSGRTAGWPAKVDTKR